VALSSSFPSLSNDAITFLLPHIFLYRLSLHISPYERKEKKRKEKKRKERSLVVKHVVSEPLHIVSLYPLFHCVRLANISPIEIS